MHRTAQALHPPTQMNHSNQVNRIISVHQHNYVRQSRKAVRQHQMMAKPFDRQRQMMAKTFDRQRQMMVKIFDRQAAQSHVAQQQREKVALAHHLVKVGALHPKVPQVCEKLF